MRKLVTLSLFVLALVGTLWFALSRRDVAVATKRIEAPVADSSSKATVELDPLATSTISEVQVALDGATRVRPAPAAPADPLPETMAELRARFVLDDGTPAEGVLVHLEGRVLSETLAQQIDSATQRLALEGKSAADGQFVLRFEPPSAFALTAETHLRGWAGSTWRNVHIAAGEVRDLGTITLQRAATLIGSVVDAEGRPLTGSDWTVIAKPLARAGAIDADSSTGSAKVDVLSARFRIEDLTPGGAQLSLYGGMTGFFEAQKVELRAGEITSVDIVCREPVAQRIRVIPIVEPWMPVRIRYDSIALTGSGVERRDADEHSTGFDFDAVAPGKYTLAIDDPRFEAWSAADVEPGTATRARLRGSAAVKLTVVDALTRAPIERFRVRVRWDEWTSRPNVFDVLRSGVPQPTDGVYHGLLPQRETVLVSAEGYVEAELPVELQPGEVRALTAELHRGARIEVVALESDGATPVASGEVTLDRILTAPAGGRPAPDDEGRRLAHLDRNGRVSFANVAAGSYRVRVARTPLLAAETKLDIAIGELAHEARIVFERSGWIRGRITARVPFDPTMFHITAEPLEVDRVQRFNLDGRLRAGADRVGSDGAFRIGPLPAGKLALFAELPSSSAFVALATRGFQGVRRKLCELELEELHELRRDFDVTDLVPGLVEVRATRHGAALPFAAVLFVEPRTNTEHGSVATLDSRGYGTSGPLLPGRVNVRVHPPNNAWVWCASESVEIRAGETTSLTLDVHITEATLELVDGSGSPIRKRDVVIQAPTGAYTGADGFTDRTDEQGKLALALQPGSYTLQVAASDSTRARRDAPSASDLSFEWTEAGPNPTVLTIR